MSFQTILLHYPDPRRVGLPAPSCRGRKDTGAWPLVETPRAPCPRPKGERVSLLAALGTRWSLPRSSHTPFTCLPGLWSLAVPLYSHLCPSQLLSPLPTSISWPPPPGQECVPPGPRHLPQDHFSGPPKCYPACSPDPHQGSPGPRSPRIHPFNHTAMLQARIWCQRRRQ